MKRIIIACLGSLLLISCSYVEPYKINGKEESTLRCIRRASWEPMVKHEDGFIPPDITEIELENATGKAVLYDFIPWWGDMDNYVIATTVGVKISQLPDTYIAEEQTSGLRILEPYFFHDGALLFVYAPSSQQEKSSGSVRSFDLLRVEKISPENIRKKKLTISIGKTTNKSW